MDDIPSFNTGIQVSNIRLYKYVDILCSSVGFAFASFFFEGGHCDIVVSRINMYFHMCIVIGTKYVHYIPSHSLSKRTRSESALGNQPTWFGNMPEIVSCNSPHLA